MAGTQRHIFQVLTKRPENIVPFLERTGAELPPNAWIGTTVERGDFLGRVDILRTVPARVRFLSLEPLLGPLDQLELARVDWCIVGGESGPRARPMRAEWVRSIRDACLATGVALFFKQWGLARNNPLYRSAPAGVSASAFVATQDPHGKGGALLDGELWREFPEL